MLTETQRDDLEKRFNHHPPISKEAGDAFGLVRSECRHLAALLTELCPTGREASLALTKLEEVMFWANGAIARNQLDAVNRYLEIKRIAALKQGQLAEEVQSR